MGLSLLSRKKRRVVLGAGAAVVALSAFGIYSATSGDEASGPVDIDFALGGGTTNGTWVNKVAHGTDLAIHGHFRGLAATTDDTVYLFTQEEKGMVMWIRKSSGSTARIPITGLNNETAEEAAVASDGSVYLATGDLWKVSPSGTATKLIDTQCPEANLSPLGTTIKSICVEKVTGVNVTKDGSVYIGDQIAYGNRGSFVHKISGESVELIAGRSAKNDESLKDSNPAVQKGVDPPAGTKAKDVLAPAVGPSGYLASDDHGLYWRTGPGIVRINKDGTLSSVVGARDPKKIGELQGPLETIGRAIDARVNYGASFTTNGDLTASSARDEIFYTDTGKAYGPPFSREFSLGGTKSTAQKSFIKDQKSGKVIFRVAGGNISPVAFGAQAIAATDSSLYIAVESSAAGNKSPGSQRAAVLKLDLSVEK
ncbi:hypothetical protein ACIPEL_34915 [Streptomyces griseoviridis]